MVLCFEGIYGSKVVIMEENIEIEGSEKKGNGFVLRT